MNGTRIALAMLVELRVLEAELLGQLKMASRRSP